MRILCWFFGHDIYTYKEDDFEFYECERCGWSTRGIEPD